MDLTDLCPQLGCEGQKEINEILAGKMERMIDMFEKEWGRREVSITGRFQRLISDLTASGKFQGL